MSDQNPYGENPYSKNPPGPGPYDPNGSAPGYGYPQTGGTGQAGYGYPQAGPPTYPPPGYGQPGPLPAVPATGDGGWQHGGRPAVGSAATLVTIGDIAVTSEGILTPAGPMPLKGAVWTVTDMSRTEQGIPAYAIVLAIIFFLACLLGLLFLLIKETKTTGFIQVTVNSGGRYHATMIPVRSPADFFAVNQMVNYARTLCV